MSGHFHSNRCTNTLPAAGCPAMRGAAPACPPFIAPALPVAPLAPAAAAPALALAPAVFPTAFMPALPPAVVVFVPALPSGPVAGSEPTPQAANAHRKPVRKMTLVFTFGALTVLARVQPVKPNRGKYPAFTAVSPISAKHRPAPRKFCSLRAYLYWKSSLAYTRAVRRPEWKPWYLPPTQKAFEP
jgi:hypothetical protein